MSAPIRLLYAEDNPHDADLTRARLAGCAEEFQLEIVDTGRKCLQRATEAERDLVLLGHHLPDLDGLDVLTALVNAGAQVPVVLATSASDEQLAVKALRLGAANYVSKQGDYLETLPALLRAAVAEHRRKKNDGLLLAAPRRILYVEHALTDIESTLRHFSEAAPSFVVDVVHTCAAALLKLTEPHAYDLVLADLRMPDQSALDLVREAKLRRLELPPIILISSKGDDAAAIAALRLGATSYIAKRDGYLNELVYVIDQAIANDRLRRLNEHLQIELDERRRAEVELLRLGRMLDVSLNELYVFDAQTLRFQYANEGARRNLGYSAQAMSALTPLDLKPQFTESSFRQMIESLLRHEQKKCIFDTVHRRADGSEYPVEVHLQLIELGGTASFLAVINDITERKRTEADLRQAKDRLQQAVSAGQVGLWNRDLRTDKVNYSPEWKRQLGYAEEEISDDISEWRNRVHPEDLDGVMQALQEYIRGARSTYVSEFRLRHKDGSYRHILARGSKLLDENGKPVRILGSHVDITERTQLQAQFLQAQKMASVGQLAGGVAHDFNNLLTVIIGTVDLALVDLRADDPLRAHLDQVLQSARRASLLTQQLLAFSRQQILHPKVIDLNSVVAEMQSMLRRLIGENITLQFLPAQELDCVRADPGQISQVILNLAVNARDAMPTGGTLTIELRNVELDKEYASAHVSVEPGRYVMLCVSDTGTGMSEATRLRIFEPFFTTKPAGKGTGLGLSTVYGIVTQSGGSIAAYSEVGLGTTFKIYLPGVEAAPRDEPPRVPTRAAGTETVLVVEDEPAVRALATRALESAGYSVLSAGTGEEALRILGHHAGPVHLMMTDVVLPGIGGPLLAAQTASSHPQMKVLYASGYTDDAILRHGVLANPAHFLSKPYSLADLHRAVRDALDSPRRDS
jgi:two-component system, cell cycle sensor histidine kinase and response regulator CckA